ncbi:MAG: dCMP deaminase family protein [Patescibacteria group bacterium]|nr:dCMP deaminase family protein [Patescibacteria group bacterium]
MPKPKRINNQEKKNKRPSWKEYFLSVAKIASSRSTCDRLRVGAVIVKNKAILSTGYNGSSRGLPHCDDVGHEISDGHCIRTIHAEANALVHAARHGIAIDGATMFLTNSPCYDCFKMIVNAGIKEVVYSGFYMSRYGASKKVLDLAKKAGVKIKHLEIKEV